MIACVPARAADDEVSRLIGELRTSDPVALEKTQARLTALGKRSVSPLLRALSEDPTTRRNAVKTIARIGPPAAAAVPFLMLLAGNQDYQTLSEAHKALIAIGEPALERVTRGLSDEEWDETCVRLIADFGPAARVAIPQLVRILELNKLLRDLAATALVKIGPDGRSALRRALVHSDAEVRAVAALALTEPPGESTPELLKVLIALLDHEKMYQRRSALEALTRLGPAAAVATEPVKRRLASDVELRPVAQATLDAITRR